MLPSSLVAHKLLFSLRPQRPSSTPSLQFPEQMMFPKHPKIPKIPKLMVLIHATKSVKQRNQLLRLENKQLRLLKRPRRRLLRMLKKQLRLLKWLIKLYPLPKPRSRLQRKLSL